MDNKLGFNTQHAIEHLKDLPKDPRDFLTEEDKKDYLDWVEDTRKKRIRAMERSAHIWY